ncbi:vacuolar protein sorting-associated protein 13A isoform X2 [Alosa sapidissima]|uniref:vacuolar protein sorting-associated protein 13A isoform X2 n=1 Tax=Alosa sapidissima TaxID=34773 RepID=UPI001C0949DF|nr:vacuolar protein sorting-associated protein 13A isoform X2 [Alosa sapidissima]
MVFESVVVDVLNRFLGDYVVNLDSSQLSLGIWGGDAILKNLEIKENALSQLDIPFKVRAGHIGRLELKIPWKNLYTQSVEATLDEVYLLIVPTASIKYDAEKEERQLQEARQRELQRIEETKQRAAEQENPQLQKQDTFVEKLVTQVIKNLQVKISNIHIRYEDDITNPSSPISFGVSLQNLSLQTADANWHPCLLDDKAKLFFKLVRLDSLFAYWNTNSELYSNHAPDQALRCLRHNVAVEGSIPQDYQYVFRPISARAKLRMNPRSDVDLSAPKVDLMVNLPNVSVELSRPQYVSILELLGSVDMMSRNLPYRKYRPDLPLHNNAFLWWRYVIAGILEVNVKPRLHMWSWQHIRRHRQTVKRYRGLYKHKITNKKPMESMLRELQETEKTLDIFNITLARQQAEMEAMRAGLPVIRPGQKAEVEESQGWFGWMWSWGSETSPKSKETVKTGGFDDLMTPAEKDKLYKAIGYSEIAVNHNLPKNFVDMKVSFQLVSMSVSLKESSDKPEILKLAVMDLSAMLTQRPGAQAFGVSAQLSSFEVTGLPRNRVAPILLSSRRVAVENHNPLLTLMFETNPLDGSADQKLHADAQPLEIIYDAMTVNSLSTFFLLPDDVQLDELTNATLMKLEQFKDRTATGLMYVIETQKVLDLRVNLMASYVIVPQGGFYSGKENLILLDLGHLKMSSKTRKGLPHLSVGSSTLEDIMSRAYDSFDIQLSNLQFLYSKADGDWRAARKLKRSALHVLEPVDLRVELSRAMVVTDSRMPKFKISGELPLLSLRISDDKVRGVLALVDSIPLPESRPTPTPKPSAIQLTPKPSKHIMTTPQVNPRKGPSLAEMRSSMFYDAISITSMSSEEELFFDAPSSPVKDQPFLFEVPPSSLSRSASLRQRTMATPEPQKNMTDFLILFMIQKLSIQLCRVSDGEEVTVLHLSIEGLGAELKKRTFDIRAETFLREICLACPEYTDAEDKPVHLITTLDNTEDDLLILEYTKADKTSPEFKTVYNNTEQLVKVNFSSLDVHLYTEALVNTMNFLSNLVPASSPEPAPPPVDDEQGEGDEEEEKEQEKKEGSAVVKAVSKRSKGGNGEVVNMHIRADLSSLKLFIRGEKARIAEIHIEGLVSEVVMKKTAMEVQANLKNIIILDCDKEALYQKAVSIADKEVFAFRMVNYTDATQGDAYKDMSCVDTDISLTVGCIQLIFLYKFFSSILTFVDNFQTAKAALAEVTAQAAEKAAVGVRELAERSSRISLAVRINAPVLFLPQSSSSPNVIVADLGRVVVSNAFAMESTMSPLRKAIPPITDNMKVELSHLKMYRTTFAHGKFQNEVELLKPVNMDLTIKRNLSAAWYHNIPDIQIDAHLRPMSLVLSQEDLAVVLRTLSENLSETASEESTPSTAPPDKADTTSNKENTVVISAVVEAHQSAKLETKLKLDFKFDSLTLLLYSPAETPQQGAREPRLMLAEFTLGSIHTQLLQLSDGAMNATVRLSECLLDDKRSHIKSVTSRMMAQSPGAEKSVMLVLSYRAGREGTSLQVALQDLYLCASMEFLQTVANVFLEALANGRPAAPRNGRPTNASSSATSTKDTVPAQPPTVLRNTYSVMVKNPEVVFVADLTRPDAPALVMTTQVEAEYNDGPDGQRLTAVVRDLKVTACPFLRQQRKPNHVTTVLQPCELFFNLHMPTSQPQSMELSISALTLKVSPIIINTVITIQSALTPAPEGGEGDEKESPMPPDLWEHRDLRQLKLWFLEEEGEEDARSLAPLVPQGDTLKLGIDTICLTLEAGVGHRTVPMLLAKASFHGDAKNLSTLINLHSTLNLEVHYYNEIMGVWEPLLEPLEDETSDGFRPWSLELKMKKKPLKHSGIADEVDFSVPDYKTVISVSSKDQLNIMLSKCGLNMLSNLGMAFAAATQTAESFQRDQAPLVLKNHLGVALSVLLSDMFVHLVPETHGDTVSLNRSKSTDRRVDLLDGQNLFMDFASDQFSAMTSLNAKNYYIQPTPVGHSEASIIPLIKVGRGMYSVLHNESHVTRFFVCQIYSVEGSKYVKIRSPFQIINHSTVSFRVFEGSTCLGTSLPTEEFCVPLGSYRAQLSLQPVNAVEGAEAEYGPSEGFSYETVTSQPGECVEQACSHLRDSECVFKVNMVAMRDTVTLHSTEENFDPPYVLHLWPSVQLRNLLPYPITYCLQGTTISTPAVLEAGHSCQLHTALLDQHTVELRLLDYMQQDWVAQYSLRSGQDEISFLTFSSLSASEEGAELDVGVHVRYEAGQALLALHSPYWMVNKTGRLLQYKSDDVHHKHPKDYSSPLLFSFKPRNFFQNNKVRLMISDSELSDEFSIDTVGSYGDVKCKGRLKDYLVGVKIDATSFSLTRVVTFVPFYVLENHTRHLISVCEEGHEQWTEAPPLQSAVPFWPERESKKLKVKVEGCQSTQVINFHKPENCLLLHLDNTLGGITVDVNLTEHLAVVRFSNYHDGAAPFLLINHTKEHTLQYHQSSQREIVELEAGQAVYYTWAEPTGSRVLNWSWGHHSGELKIEEDLLLDVGGEGSLFLLSFYEGLQRVALFTQSKRLYQNICNSEKAELANQEIILALQDLGVSLVNNTTSQEVAFIGICSSDVVWECKLQKKNRWKTLSVKDADVLERSYREYMESNPVDNKILTLPNDSQVSLTPSGLEMRMLKPYDALLRRNFLPALKVEYKVSARQQAYRVQINHIQIQNQLPGAIFPVVYYPVKPPKSVSMDSEPKPLTDVSIITRAAGHSDILRIKYFKVLIQEMDLRLDLGFLYALLDLFTQEHIETVTTEQEVELFQKDIEYIKTQLHHVSSTDSSPISLYEYFHISPIKLHLSFSLSTGGEDGQKEKRQTELIPVQSLNLLLKSIGATLTDVQDVVFKLGFFQMTYKFNTRSQLQWEVIRHYSKQAIKQMYVLVLGLDVLGNPFGLIRGLSEGVEAFFYEPYQGAIQGPEEFVEGMALGVKALAGAAVGGLAGAASRITGAMAKGVAAMTLDEEYQQKRREAMNRQPRGLKEGLARGGKGLVSGFVSGITGIVTKPIKGAQQEGAAGFFKGVGKGLVGAVTRPTGGIIDMASSTFQGIKRATEPSQDVDSLRPPRFIHDDGVIRPYREREGLGSQMLQKIENGRFAKYRYFAHAKVNESDFLMITKRGIFFVTKGTFGQLTCEWQYLFDEFTKEPMIVEDRRLRIEAKERVKSVFHAKEFGKIINFKTPEIAKWVLTKLEDARESLPKY